MAVGELFAAWLFERVLNRAVGSVLGPKAEKASADCFRIAARVAARAAIEGHRGAVDEASIAHLTRSFEDLFDIRLPDVGVDGTDVSDRLLFHLLRDAVVERFRALNESQTPDGESQAAALGIDTDAVGRHFFAALITAMRGRPELQPLRSALFDEVHTTQLNQLLDDQAGQRQLLQAVRQEMTRISCLVEAGHGLLAGGQLVADPVVEPPPVPKRPLPDGFEPGREEEAQLLRILLRDEPSDPAPRAVVGLTTALLGAGGFGKTTLAEWLIDQPEVREHFERILWVEVGIDPNLESVVANAYLDLTGQQPDATSLVQLTTLFAQAVGSQRLLIVVDDVWSRQALTPFVDDTWGQPRSLRPDSVTSCRTARR